MKSTKNVLMAGVILAIALFISIPVSAMEKEVNPYLSQREKATLELYIKSVQEQLDPKGYHLKNLSPRAIKIYKQQLEQLEKMYYGNEAYTVNDMRYIMNVV
ncbi:MAG TPA: hypothetical protein VHX42_02010 [Candidatus Babeliales bacterium]|jgi:hypothetical protein|nr:hypothetical protein [Candidatus Babeliales bacterium]